VRSFAQAEKERKKDNRKEKGPNKQRSWGATLAKGLGTMEKKVRKLNLARTSW
jgi:hypothetical protein